MTGAGRRRGGGAGSRDPDRRPADPWQRLGRELDAWAAAGRTATVWWRDDDARAPTPELERLFDLQARCRAPLALAAVPSGLDPAIGRWTGRPGVTVFQHGFAHRNHAAPGQKRVELGPGRRPAAVLAELRRGQRIIAALPGARPVLVPPWNRIDPALTAMLADAGYVGLSAFGPRWRARPAPGLAQVNAHVDPVDWKGSRGFRGPEAVIGDLVRHLGARRAGAVDAREATGLLTHHLVHDDDAWSFAEELLLRLGRHPAARLADGDELFAAAP